MVTFAPTSDIFSATLSASSLETPSLIGLGASSTTAFASFRPRPVSSRTTLMTLILLGPTSLRIASNSVCSSTGAAAGAASDCAAGPAATETGAALTPQRSCRALVNLTRSSTFSCSISSMMESTVMVFFLSDDLFCDAAHLIGACLQYVTEIAQRRGQQTVGCGE